MKEKNKFKGELVSALILVLSIFVILISYYLLSIYVSNHRNSIIRNYPEYICIEKNNKIDY